MTNPMTDQGFFTNLPSENIIDILARLPVRTIIRCKRICKSFLRLIRSHEFWKLYLSKSAPLLAIPNWEDESPYQSYSFFEVEEGPDLQLNFKLVTKFNLPDPLCLVERICVSVNGLLLLLDKDETDEHFLICNPLTRQYIRIPYHQLVDINRWITFGFGASRKSGKLKVVRIFEKLWENHCEVYTLGTGSWRRIAHADTLKYVNEYKHGLFLNGNLHWLVQDPNGYSWISCFDLEAELFTTFSTPNPRGGTSGLKLVAPLGDHLCICEQDIKSNIIIWLMKEYRVEKSWTKEFVIDHNTCVYVGLRYINPIKVLSDGGLLTACATTLVEDMIYYSVHYAIKDEVRRNVIRLNCIFVSDAILHTASFVSLESFGMEDVRSF